MKLTIRNDEDTVGVNVLVKKTENGSPAPEVTIPPAGEHDFEIHEGGFLTVTTLRDSGTVSEPPKEEPPASEGEQEPKGEPDAGQVQQQGEEAQS